MDTCFGLLEAILRLWLKIIKYIINSALKSRNFKALLIIYLIIFNQSLKMASSKPKHVAVFS